MRLVNVARASLDELLLDFEDYLRQHGLRQWAKDDPRAQAVRGVGKDHRTDRLNPTDRTERTLPVCPLCGKPMALRTAHKGQHAGSQFWGCSGYPECKGTKKLEGSVRADRSDG